ncbi:hypothetical protein M752DRAFT_294544 [Aspergillus phoenicis ATCC 13157]|uniref:Uncharacterized protein n=1 Tax=Aspergillus phoenicis ATCC 13157 TaxID=1353007 RepID=A0A370PHM7_ASPPH|nr:hypothetical protein M752DRAFT_294544 [Aspergillus phoenicis ATCC 13157]
MFKLQLEVRGNDGKSDEQNDTDTTNKDKKALEEARKNARRAESYIKRVRNQLGWDVREFDLQRLRYIRRSSYLSPVLCGQDLFTIITSILYKNKHEPSTIHHAIARLAHAQYMPDRQSLQPS